MQNGSSSDDALVSIQPAPVARAGMDLNVCANTSVRFDGRQSTDVDGVVNRFSWDFGDGQAGGGDQPEHTYLDPGTYRATLQIEGDNLGLCSPISNDELVVTVRSAPKPAIAAPDAAATNQEVVFDGTGSSIESHIALTYEWDFGDGVLGTGAIAKHAYAKPGDYSVKLQVTAPAEAGGCASTQLVHLVKVNAAPVADAGADRIVEVNQPLLLSGAGSRDPDGGIAEYRWEFGDGENARGVEVRHIWRKAGRHLATLTVSDGTGLPNETNARSIWVDVAEAPKVEIHSASMICVGNAVAFSLANLPADTDQSRLTWSFGDGTSGSGGNISHAYCARRHLCGRRRRSARSRRQRRAYAGHQGRRGQPAADRPHRSRAQDLPRRRRSRSMHQARSIRMERFPAMPGISATARRGQGAKVEHGFAKPGTYPVHADGDRQFRLGMRNQHRHLQRLRRCLAGRRCGP